MRNVLTVLISGTLALAGCSSDTTDDTGGPAPANCAALKSANPSAADGMYLIDPDGSAGPAPAFSVWCDMTYDGGGWTALPLKFKDPTLWSLTYSGTHCTDGPSADDKGSLQSVYNGAGGMWDYLSMKFVPPIPVKQVWLKNLHHSTSSVENDMDLSYVVTPESTGLNITESWYFAGTDPKVPLGYTFADGCTSPGYASETSGNWGTPVCQMGRNPGTDNLVDITRQIKLSSQASQFHMVAVQGCGTDMPVNGKSERFHINHPSGGGLWKDGILVR